MSIVVYCNLFTYKSLWNTPHAFTYMYTYSYLNTFKEIHKATTVDLIISLSLSKEKKNKRFWYDHGTYEDVKCDISNFNQEMFQTEIQERGPRRVPGLPHSVCQVTHRYAVRRYVSQLDRWSFLWKKENNVFLRLCLYTYSQKQTHIHTSLLIDNVYVKSIYFYICRIKFPCDTKSDSLNYRVIWFHYELRNA